MEKINQTPATADSNCAFDASSEINQLADEYGIKEQLAAISNARANELTIEFLRIPADSEFWKDAESLAAILMSLSLEKNRESTSKTEKDGIVVTEIKPESVVEGVSSVLSALSNIPPIDSLDDFSWLGRIGYAAAEFFVKSKQLDYPLFNHLVTKLRDLVVASDGDFALISGGKGASREAAGAMIRVCEDFAPQANEILGRLGSMFTGLPAGPTANENVQETLSEAEMPVLEQKVKPFKPVAEEDRINPMEAARMAVPSEADTQSVTLGESGSAPTSPVATEPAVPRVENRAVTSVNTVQSSGEDIWEFLDAEQPEGAFWAARSWEVSGSTPPIHSSVLALLAASRWAQNWSGEAIESARALAQSELGSESSEARLVRLSASLLPSVVLVESAVTNHWLHDTHTGLPGVDQLLTDVRLFSARNRNLTGQAVAKALSRVDPESVYQSLSSRAAAFLKDGQYLRINYHNGQRTYNEVFVEVLRPLLKIVEEHSPKDAAAVQKAKARLHELHITSNPKDAPDSVDELIQRHNVAVHGNKAPQIVAWARDRLRGRVNSGLEIVWDWIEVAGTKSLDSKEGDWIRFVSEFRAKVLNAGPKARFELTLALANSTMPKRAAQKALSAAIGLLEGVFRPGSYPNAFQYSAGSRDIVGYAAPWLFHVPTCDVDAQGLPVDLGSLHLLLDTAAISAPASEKAAIWLSKGVFGPLDAALAFGWLGAGIELEVRQAREKRALETRKAIDDAATRVEEHLLNRQIDAVVRSELIFRLQNLRQQAEDPIQGDFWGIRREIKKILDDLDQLAVGFNPERWFEAKTQAQAREPLPREVEETIHRGDLALEKRSTVEINEYVARLREWLDGAIEDSELLVEATNQAGTIEDFVRHQEVLRALSGSGSLDPLKKALEKGTFDGIPGLTTVPLPEDASTDATLELIDSFNGCWGNTGIVKDALPRLFQALGFDLSAKSAFKFDSKSAMRNVGQWTAEKVTNQHSPVPEFGSKAHLFNIVLLSDPNGENSVGGVLQAGKINIPTLLIFKKPLDLATRRKVWKTVKDRRAVALVFDPLLVAQLCLTPLAHRERALFELTLPGVTLNPYHTQPKVEPEMFKGRRSELEQLKSDRGPVIVYGGRKLGKTAVLNHLADDFNAQLEHVAVYVDIASVGDQAAGSLGADAVRGEIGRALANSNVFLPGAKRGTNDVNVYKCIEEGMNAHGQEGLRVLVLLDEADNFLEADRLATFSNFKALWDLRRATNYRFKFILAGLHDVQRFASDQNLHNVYWGDSVRIGVLNPTSIQGLILEPFNALGFRLETDVVTRIIAESNSHTGLIQVMCRELLDQVKDRTTEGLPPYEIKTSQFIQLLRQPLVAKRVSEMFHTTLRLDIRYRAIALAMVYDFLSKVGDAENIYSVAAVRSLLSQTCAALFASAGDAELRSLLDEMVGLGLLVKTRDSFRLRTPNLVTMFGSVEDVFNALSELQNVQPPGRFDPRKHHSFIDNSVEKLPDLSPLTTNQQTGALRASNGISIIVGSDMTRLNIITKVAERVEERRTKDMEDEGVGRVQIILPNKTADFVSEVARQVGASQASGIGSQSAIAICNLKTIEDFGQIVEAQKFYQSRRQATRRWIRIVFLMDPSLYWALESNTGLKTILRKEGVAVEFMRPFVPDGLNPVVERLVGHESGLMDRLFLNTGGWPLAVLQVRASLVDQNRPEYSSTDVAAAIDGLKEEFWKKFSTKQLAAAFGLAEAPVLRAILEGIGKFGSIAPAEVAELKDLGLPGLSGVDPSMGRIALETLAALGLVIPSPEDLQKYALGPFVERSLGA